MLNDISNWYKTIPIFNNETPRDLTSFKPNEKFTDETFLTYTDSLISEVKYQEIMNNPYDPDRTTAELLYNIKEWKRISDLFLNSKLFPPELNCDTFCQGKIGDCYFVSMISLISNYGEMLTRLFPILENEHGYYEVILFINGWKRVIVDDFLPVIIEDYNYKLITCTPQKYENCFYFMLLEKAWAKVNKNYYNIFNGDPYEALLVLTGLHGEVKDFGLSPEIFGKEEKKKLIEDMREHIRRKGSLYGAGFNGHAYAILNVQQYTINNNNYQVLQIRDPYGQVRLKEIYKHLDLKFNNLKAIVEDDLLPIFQEFNQTPDNGIFYISNKYFLQLFDSLCQNYFMPNSTNIDFLFKFDLEDIYKNYFFFEMTVDKISLVHFNLTSQFFDKKTGKMKFRKPFKIKMNPNFSNENDDSINIGNYNRVSRGRYFVEWKYDDNVGNVIIPPKEILFWIYFEGKIDVNFLGMSENSQIEKYFYGLNFKTNNGMKFEKKIYRISEKLGLYYKRMGNIKEFVERVLHCNINSDVEEKGYSLTYQENGNVAFSFIMNKEDLKKSKILSQNMDFPEYIFEGNLAQSRRIIGDGNIYFGDNIVYRGKINYNLFPQFVQEKNDNDLIIRVEAKRFKLSQEINEDELVNINVLKKGPFKGQLKKSTHPHALTKCITPYRNGWICDQCGKYFNTTISSFYCSVCDFDFCSENCVKPNSTWRERPEHYYPQYHFKSLQHNHPLICVKLLDRNNNLKCFSCLQNILPENKIFYCTKCDFRLCEKCQINEKSGNTFQFHCSWHPHPLTFCKTKGKKEEKKKKDKCLIKPNQENLDDSDFFFTCNHCGIIYSRIKDSFYCTACDFYICMKCYKDYFFYIGRENENAKNINMGNQQVFPVLCKCFLYDENENVSTIKCKKCNVDIKLENQTYDAYYCSICNSNFCIKCYSCHKVLFQDNVLIFDGYFQDNRKHGFGVSYKKNNDINFSGNWENGEFKLINEIPHSHLFKRKSFNNNIQCDICLKLCDIYDTGISCSSCNFNICDKCLIEINSKLVNSSKIHPHILEFEKASTSSSDNICNICNFPIQKLHFVCKICNKNTMTSTSRSTQTEEQSSFKCCFRCLLRKIK